MELYNAEKNSISTDSSQFATACHRSGGKGQCHLSVAAAVAAAAEAAWMISNDKVYYVEFWNISFYMSLNASKSFSYVILTAIR